MTCHGGFHLEEDLRREWYNPEQILKKTGLKSGMTFIDIGCGDGFFSILASEMVGSSGKVCSVDIDAKAIQKLKEKASKKSLTNIKAVSGPAENTVFCDKCADMVFYSMVLHDFTNLVQVLKNANLMLKSSGTLINIDWKKMKMSFGPPEEIRFSEETATALISKQGFIIKNVESAGPYHYILTAKPKI